MLIKKRKIKKNINHGKQIAKRDVKKRRLIRLSRFTKYHALTQNGVLWTFS